MIIKKCSVCNHRHFKDNEYCSIKCETVASEQQKKIVQPPNSPRWVVCQQCGINFFRGNKKQVFCSQNCSQLNRKSKKEEKHNVEIECPGCHKNFEIFISGYNNKLNDRFCDECVERFGRKTARRYTRSASNEDDTDLAMSQTEIAKEIGITSQAVSMYEVRALKKFKEQFEKMYPDTIGLIKMDSERYGKTKNSVIFSI